MPLKREELNQRLNIRTTQSRLLNLERLRVLTDILDANPEALNAFLTLMHERHERADINSRQALEINHKEGKIHKLQKAILDIENSEVLKLGRVIWDALQLKNNKQRKAELIQQNLVHKDDYNRAISDLKSTILELQQRMAQQTFEASNKIHDLEDRVDSLLNHLRLAQDHVTSNYGLEAWDKTTLHIRNNI